MGWKNNDESVNYVLNDKKLKKSIIHLFLQENTFHTIFLEKQFFEKLESINNKLENYIGNILDKYIKRIYMIPKGIFDYIVVKKDLMDRKLKKVLTN